MAANDKNRWVVLLNKSPKGPLTESEVKTLLSQGILRLNDVAYQVNSEEPKDHSEWKLLWQFAEFNRRNPDPSAPPEKKTIASDDGERRQKVAPEEIKKRALSELPPDLLEITPEDLIPKSTAITFSPEPGNIQSMLEAGNLRETPEDRVTPFDMRWVYAGAGVIFTSFIAMNMTGSSKPGTPSESSNSTSDPIRSPTQASGLPTGPARPPTAGPSAGRTMSLPISAPAPVLGRPLPKPAEAPSAIEEPQQSPEGNVVDSSEVSGDVMRPGEETEEEAENRQEAVLAPGTVVEPVIGKRGAGRRGISGGAEDLTDEGDSDNRDENDDNRN